MKQLISAVGAAFLLVSCSVVAAGPDYRFLWVRVMKGPCCGDAGVAMDVDAGGAALVAGHRGGIDLDLDGKLDLKAFGSSDPLIFKSLADPAKGWVQGPGGPGYDEALGVASDRQGGAYAVGYFEQNMTIAGDKIVSAGGRDGFLARYNQNGETQWAKPIGAAERDQIDAVGSDAEGNAYLLGMVSGDLDVDRDGAIDVRTGVNGLLIASFDRSGALRWARASAPGATVAGRGITAGPEGELYVSGHYRDGPLDLDADGSPEGPAPPENKPSGYFARFDTAGRMIWARTTSSPGGQAVGALATAANGDLIVLGGGDGPVDFDGDGAPEVDIPSGQRKAFVARFTPSGELAWVRTYNGAPVHLSASATHIALVGYYEKGPLDLDGDGNQEGPADPGIRSQGFVAILDTSGKLLHTFIIDGEESDRALAAGFTPDGRQLYVTGYLRLTSDFNGDGIPEAGVRCDARGDVFLAMYEIGD